MPVPCRIDQVCDLNITREDSEVGVHQHEAVDAVGPEPVKVGLHAVDVELADLRHCVRSPIAEATAIWASTVGFEDCVEGGARILHQVGKVLTLCGVRTRLEQAGYLRISRQARSSWRRQVEPWDLAQVEVASAQGVEDAREGDLAVLYGDGIDIGVAFEELRILVVRVWSTGYYKT